MAAILLKLASIERKLDELLKLNPKTKTIKFSSMWPPPHVFKAAKRKKPRK